MYIKLNKLFFAHFPRIYLFALMGVNRAGIVELNGALIWDGAGIY